MIGAGDTEGLPQDGEFGGDASVSSAASDPEAGQQAFTAFIDELAAHARIMDREAARQLDREAIDAAAKSSPEVLAVLRRIEARLLALWPKAADMVQALNTPADGVHRVVGLLWSMEVERELSELAFDVSISLEAASRPATDYPH